MTISFKQSPKILWAAVLLFAAYSACAGALINVERAAALKVTAIGTRLAGNMQVPAYSVDARTGLDLGPQERALAELPVLPDAIKAASISWIHLTGYGWLLIPRGWRVVDAGVGADGSMALMAQANAGDSWLEYTDAGYCVGCAIGQARCFYPQAQAQAVEFEYDAKHCELTGTKASASRLPALQYQLRKTDAQHIQTLRNYEDLDGIRFQQLKVHQPSLHNARSTRIDLKRGALGVFFRRIWVAAD